MKLSLKITVYENVYDEVYFSKVARLQCEESNFTISRLNQRFSLEYAPKISCLKKNNLRKKSVVNQSKFLTCNPVVHSPRFNQKRSSCKIF